MIPSVAPTSVTLKGRGQTETLEVTEGEEITLDCLVEAAKPVASVIWYKNDRRIALGKLPYNMQYGKCSLLYAVKIIMIKLIFSCVFCKI